MGLVQIITKRKGGCTLQRTMAYHSGTTFMHLEREHTGAILDDGPPE